MDELKLFLKRFFMSSSIAFTFSTLTILQEGIISWEIVKWSLLGVIIAIGASVCSFIHSVVVEHERPTKWDIIGCISGIVFTVLIYTLGVAFYYWSQS
jgi:MFS-type transporter involved in bile tolerance (Atg22 family)